MASPDLSYLPILQPVFLHHGLNRRIYGIAITDDAQHLKANLVVLQKLRGTAASLVAEAEFYVAYGRRYSFGIKKHRKPRPNFPGQRFIASQNPRHRAPGLSFLLASWL